MVRQLGSITCVPNCITEHRTRKYFVNVFVTEIKRITVFTRQMASCMARKIAGHTSFLQPQSKVHFPYCPCQGDWSRFGLMLAYQHEHSDQFS